MLRLHLVQENGKHSETQWKIGDHPMPGPMAIRGAVYLELTADGSELQFIRETFSNVPLSARAQLTWFAEDARFIAANI